MDSNNLFNMNTAHKSRSPLADKLRPKILNDFYGQKNILDDNSVLRKAILNDKLGNIILSGPPGVGKTTLVEVISNYTRSELVKLNAVFSGIKELRTQILIADERWKKSKRKTIIFIDEVHRFNSSQQDALLPSIENGTITFIGATTENPFFSVNKALLSRSRIFKLQSLGEKDLRKIIDKVINYYSNIEEPKIIKISDDAINHLIQFASGDARNLINALELAVSITPVDEDEVLKINLSIAEDSIQNKNLNYDKNGQNHFDTISAFIKSIRGSDPDAVIYWLAFMLEAGEDPNYILRRLFISASEDIGLADPNAIVVVDSCSRAFDRVGFPEGYFFLTQASLYLAIAPKSNSNKCILKAIEKLKTNDSSSSVPHHLKNNSPSYKNPHNYPSNSLKQRYLPEDLKEYKIWEPSNNGWEKNRYDELSAD